MNMKHLVTLILIILIQPIFAKNVHDEVSFYFRINQYGYHLLESKQALLFSDSRIKEKIEIISVGSKKMLDSFRPLKTNAPTWGTYQFYYTVDFSEINVEGNIF
jgi:endoglucanase